MQTYLGTGHLQVTNLEMGVRVLPEEYPHIYVGLCRYSRVYGGLNEISEPDSG